MKLVAVLLPACCSALHIGMGRLAGLGSRPRVAMSTGDEDLWASLRQRVTAGESGAAPVLGPDDVGAADMGPSDVIKYVMNSLIADSAEGARVLMSFAARDDKQEDSLGQLAPGGFGSPDELINFFNGHERYASLTRLEEWKPMGGPDLSNLSRNAAAKLLVRRPGRNWEELFVNLVLVECEGPARKRWLITNIYKQGTP